MIYSPGPHCTGGIWPELLSNNEFSGFPCALADCAKDQVYLNVAKETASICATRRDWMITSGRLDECSSHTLPRLTQEL